MARRMVWVVITFAVETYDEKTANSKGTFAGRHWEFEWSFSANVAAPARLLKFCQRFSGIAEADGPHTRFVHE
jgi:hypothetical protein